MAATPSMKEETLSKAEEEWDEGRLESALDRLQQMHVDLRKLRDTIPSIVRPIHTEYSSPEDLYADFSSAAKEAVEDVRQFKALMRDSTSKDILERARESKAHDGEGIETWLVEQHANWLDEPTVRRARELKIEDEVELQLAEPPAPTEALPIDQIVKAFKERHPEVTINLQESIYNILLILPSPAKLTFSIAWNPNNPSNKDFEATTKGPTKLHTSINQALLRREKKDDLNWTLEMITSYINVKQQRCDKCNQLHDSNSLFPVVREGSPTDLNDTSSPIEWECYHFSCLIKPPVAP